MMSRRRFLAALAAMPAAGMLYGFGVEPRWVEHVRRSLPIAGLPAPLAGRTLVQLSDVHVGPHVAEGYLRTVFAQVTALAPEIVVYTGDFVTYEGARTLAQLAELSSSLPHGSLGTFAVLGNHDYGAEWAEPEVAERIVDELERAGCVVLRNEMAHVAGLAVIGLDDLWAKRCEPEAVFSKVGAMGSALVLSHNPDSCDEEGWGNYRGWVLCGHTHGGQCRAPFLPPPINPVRNKRYVAGEVVHPSGRRLYINRGVGHLHHVRFNARPEVTIFTLMPG